MGEENICVKNIVLFLWNTKECQNHNMSLELERWPDKENIVS